MSKVIECVPNFSEGKDRRKIEMLADVFRNREGVKLLNYSRDADHNRSVITVAGEPQAIKSAVIEATGKAVEIIDMTKHVGQHPRMGAVDVVPFIPIKNITMEETIEISKEVAQIVSDIYNLPVFLYEKSATAKHRENLANVRKGEFEGLADKMKLSEWKPDFGPTKPHPTAGAVAISARNPLIAYNVNLGTDNVEIAKNIAKKIRHIDGGLRYCKAMGVMLKERGITQVSMNLTDFTKTSIYQAHEMVRMEAKRYGVSVVGAEIIGLVPMQALVDSAAYYHGLENFSTDQVLEIKLID